ncbi:thioredoxin domain-containing protein [Conexibacter stalactiti]|uniref:Thioredoxin domain-containing protein n=1 Tax=Conexibacter stalactiti TaxID=1940611 RepID=A0ABU4I217_9ACTN|nr:thioredoxin domain-containing protein [Conexibacter stalactiti]MDW5598339.1 thioredoxin domain-containing protein [Conexibacter stalactiti]MEC5038981.1 thioredoxin domain-containing protein [Conexibacter stalactiti]
MRPLLPLVLSLLLLLPATASAASSAASSRLEQAVAGLPQHGDRLGRRDAPLVMELFADLQCPFCAEFSASALPRIVRSWVAGGSLQIRYRLLTFLGRDSVRAARMAIAAGEQRRLWQFTSRMFANQGQENTGYVTDDYLLEVGRLVSGLDADAALTAARADATLDPLRAADRLSQRLRVKGTPTLALGRRGGPLTLFDGAARYREIDAALRALQRR